MMHIIYQKYSNDCAIAAVAMALDMTYENVWSHVLEAGLEFTPDADTGLVPYDVIRACRYKCKWSTPAPLCPGVTLCTIKSLNRPGKLHLVTVIDGEVFDPTTNLNATISDVKSSSVTHYFDFTRVI